ncbi:MAG: TlpA disulfide reductase family protein [Chloroflexota bacterium]
MLFIAPAAMSFIAARVQPAYHVGDPIPNFSAFLLDGTPVQLRDYAGERVVLNFWATWCVPCRVEMPLLQQVHERGDVVVLAVNNAEPPSRIVDFLTEYDIELPVVLDEQGQLQAAFGIVGYPTTLFIDEQGVIYRVQRGEMSAAQLEAYIME